MDSATAATESLCNCSNDVVAEVEEEEEEDEEEDEGSSAGDVSVDDDAVAAT
jgi:hypothetical protein